ncbi:MAG: hypothetical protein C4522_02750 [Desulfobacteraceae bacterium]|nr:MAG: hypothetical protein C4522_02750 [Desulfobacteraceae bacterium]
MEDFKLEVEDLPDDLKDIAEAIGFENTVKLIKLRGGESLYLRKIESIYSPARNRAICREFNGRNYKELSKKYKLTRTHIRDIVHKK